VDGNTPAPKTDPALDGETVELLVHAFAANAQGGGEFGLGDLEEHISGRAALAVNRRHADELAGKAVRNVEEGEIGEGLVGLAETESERLQEGQRRARPAGEPGFEGFARDDEGAGGTDGGGGGRTRPAIEKGEFADAVTGSDERDRRLVARCGEDGYADATFDHYVKGVAGVAFVDDGGAGWKVADTPAGGEGLEILVGEAREERNVADELFP
jgi:hypothetical protein